MSYAVSVINKRKQNSDENYRKIMSLNEIDTMSCSIKNKNKKVDSETPDCFGAGGGRGLKHACGLL